MDEPAVSRTTRDARSAFVHRRAQLDEKFASGTAAGVCHQRGKHLSPRPTTRTTRAARESSGELCAREGGGRVDRQREEARSVGVCGGAWLFVAVTLVVNCGGAWQFCMDEVGMPLRTEDLRPSARQEGPQRAERRM